MLSSDSKIVAGYQEKKLADDIPLVLSITRMTIHNGQGVRTLILLKGCLLRCVWCSTPESQKTEPEIGVYPVRCIQCSRCVEICPINAIEMVNGKPVIQRLRCNSCGNCVTVCSPKALEVLGYPMTIEQLVTETKKDETIFKHSHGGVTISGGEPLYNAEFALKLLQAFKQQGINTGVDTSGYVPWSGIEPTLSYVDFFLWDIKHMDPKKHKEYTGVSNKLILSNARSISERKVPIYIRVPLIPSYNDSKENIKAICEFSRQLSSLVEIDIMPLHHLGKARYQSLNRPYPIDNLRLIPDNVLQDIKNLVESYGLKCVIQV
jgi:pyruvate formate lyase activating enzyme